MSEDDSNPVKGSSTKRGAAWRQQVLRRVDLLRTELLSARAQLNILKVMDARSGGAVEHPEHNIEVDRLSREIERLECLVEDAASAAHARVSPLRWWWGTEVERSWRNIREVEERLIDFVPPDELDARATEAIALAKATNVPDSDPRVQYLQALRLEGLKRGEALATIGNPVAPRAILSLDRASHYRSDTANQEVRFFRNRIVLAMGFALLADSGLIIVQWRLRSSPIIPAPDSTWTGSPWWLLVLVMMFGSVGALLSTIPAMAAVPSDFSPFNLPLPQALLKIVFGSLTAVGGLAIVDVSSAGGLVEKPTSFTALFLLAAVFGAGQQAITQFFDRRAGEILKATDRTKSGG